MSTYGGEALIPQRRMLRLFDIVQLLFNRSCSMEYMAERLEVSQRTVYRYVKLIEEMGISVDSDFYHRYFIAQDDCPVCHHEIKCEEMDPYRLEPDFIPIDDGHKVSDYQLYLAVALKEENQLPTLT
jgi:hypothetical protein